MGSGRKKSRSRPFFAARIVLFVIIAACSGGAALRSAHAAAGARTIIFVIDSSERMVPYMPSVVAAISTFAGEAKIGSTLGIISCSDSATKLVVKKIANPRDVSSVTSRLNSIEAGGEAGDVAAGVARALEELGQLRRKGDRSRKGIIVISSSRSSDADGSAGTIEAALKELDRQVPRKEWYIQYCYLNGVVDPAVESFVSSRYGFSYSIDDMAERRYTEPVEELLRVFSYPAKLDPPRIIDISGTILGKGKKSTEWVPLSVGSEIPEKMRLRVASSSRAVIALGTLGKLGLAPEAHLTLSEARKNPLSDRSHFFIELEAGSIWMNLDRESPSILRLATAGIEIEPLGGAAEAQYSEETGELIVTSFSDVFPVKPVGEDKKPLRVAKNQSIRLALGRMVGEMEPALPDALEKWKSWKRTLVGNAPLSALKFAVPAIIFPEESITLGPIKTEEIQSQDFTLQVTGVSDASQIEVEVAISLELPEGLILSSGVTEGRGPDSKILKLRADGTTGFESRRSETHIGTLWLQPAPESKVLFEKIVVPITVTTKGPLVPTSVLIGGGLTVLLVAIGLSAGRILRKTSRMISRPHGVIGRLIVITDPTGGRVGTINLEALSTKSSRLSLTVGRSGGSEVRLRHTSVNAEHCTLEAYLTGRRLETYIEPIDSARVTVDGESIRSKTRLADGVRLEIGEFIYQFEDSQMYKKVEVVRRNGKKITGILDASGMDAAGFRLSPDDAVSPSERARVKFSDIRYAIFYRRVVDVLSDSPRPMPKPDAMKRVELMFKKGNTISGYIQREYVEGRRRYVELLPLETGSDIDYTVVDYSAVVEKKFL